MQNDAKKHIGKARMRVMRQSPFYSTILIRHDFVEDETVAGMEINGSELRYHPEGIQRLSVAELAESLKHLAMHIAYGHHLRQLEMKPRQAARCKEAGVEFDQAFNVAGDLAVNSLLRKANEIVWGSENMKDAAMPGIGKYIDLADECCAEDYFGDVVKIMEMEPKQESDGGGEGQGQGSGSGEGGSDCSGDGEDDGEGESDQSPEGEGESKGDNKVDKDAPMNFGQVAPPNKPQRQAEQEHGEQIAAATMNAKSAGEGTGSVNEIIAMNEAPVKVDWKSETREFIQSACRGRPNYRHINRRMFGTSIVFPTYKDKTVKKIVLLVDVSGSMNDECVGAVYQHIESLIEAHPSLEITLVPFDDGIFKDHIKVFNRENCPIDNSARGRTGWGGTRFMSAVKWAEEQDEVAGVIMLTDMMPVDKEEFIDYQPKCDIIVLSVFEYAFGSHGYARNYAAYPKHMKVIEIEP